MKVRKILPIIFIAIAFTFLSCNEKPTEPPEEIKPLSPKDSKWEFIGLSNVLINTIEIYPKDSQIMYASGWSPNQGYLGYVYKTIDRGLSWDTLDLRGTAYEFAFDPNNSSTIYCAGFFNKGVDVDTSSNFDVFVKSIDAGKSWIRIENGVRRSYSDLGFDIEVDFKNSNILFATSYSGGFSKSYDSGTSWVRIDNNFETINKIKVDRYNSNILVFFRRYSIIINKYATTQNDGVIYLSNDGGLTASSILSGDALISDVSISLWNKGELFAYVPEGDSLSGLIYSSNYGEEWKVKSKQVAADINFSNNFGRIIYDPSKEGFIYAKLKDSTGVYWSSDYGYSWQRLSDPSTFNLIEISPSGKYLYGTSSTGYGLFRYELK